MSELIENLSTYLFYAMGIFVFLYWLLFVPKNEKIKNIKNTYSRFKELFSKNEEYEEYKERKRKEAEKKKNDEK
ncbi:hypothetical protein V9L05_01605 [Bernardetia sp. Wsw4-3y2]|uniref:hypothetical protein n=1 Tax=Bernardetia sp. Wsw4-3y2 TaxID=3127471 RepID=UPI0030D532FE